MLDKRTKMLQYKKRERTRKLMVKAEHTLGVIPTDEWGKCCHELKQLK